MKVKFKTKKKGNKENIKKPKRKINGTGKNALIILLFIGIAVVSMFGIFCAYIVLTTKNFDPKRMTTTESSIIYDMDGKEIVTLGITDKADVEKREKVTYDDLPQVLIDALIATEDSRFFQHNGVDLARFIKASALQAIGMGAGGASTLTMQVSKNNFTDTTSTGIKGIIRKFRDIYISVFQIEKKYTKQEIIEFYLNDNLLGGNNYGVEQASQYYFGKSASDLNLAEASLLVGMYQSPNAYNPYKNPEAATKRRKTVLNLMVRHGYITKEEAHIANSIDVTSLLVDTGTQANEYDGFVDIVLDEVYEKTGLNPYKTSMQIYTTMNKSVQDGLNKIMSGETYKWKNDVVQAGIAIVDVNTGAIVGVGAGRNRNGARTFNYATMAKKQPGSTAKPVFDYGPGIEYENWSTYQLFMDEEWSYSSGGSIKNFDSKYKGLVTLKQALSNSRNIPALKAYQQLDYKNIHNFVTNLGLVEEDEPIYESYSIGGMTKGVSPLQMASAYASFANTGYHTDPYTIRKIILRDSSTEQVFNVKPKKVMKDSTAYLMTNALVYACNYGFSGGAKVSGLEVAVKTGTSNYSSEEISLYNLKGNTGKDLWTVAYTPEYSIALWYGYDVADSTYYHKSGAGTDKENVMRQVMKIIPKNVKSFKIPGSVTLTDVEFGTWPAMTPSEYTPSDLITKEAFVKGTEPTEVSPRFSKLSDVKNLNATYNSLTNSINISWNYQIPEIAQEAYLTTYFSQSVFGNSSTRLLNERISYNNNTMGTIGFGIYQKDASGNLSLINFTTNQNYTYAINGLNSIDIVVKAEYSKFKSNASNGVSKTVSINDGSDPAPTPNPTPDPTPTPQDNLSITLAGNSIINLSTNDKTYTDVSKPIIATLDNNDIYNDCIITATLSSSAQKAQNISLPIAFDISKKDTYVITYTVKYNDNEKKLVRKIIVSDPTT